MINVLEIIILGTVQGITEFLPISSSGHLVILKSFFEYMTGSIFFDVAVHIATLLAIVIYFRKDVKKLFFDFLDILRGNIVDESQKVLILSIILGTIPAAFAGYFFEDIISLYFRNTSSVAITLIIGSTLFAIAEINKKRLPEQITIKKGIAIGFFQVLALIPGFSRSGSTIAGGLLMGMDRSESARFSFLLAIPIIAGAGLKSFIDIKTFSSINIPEIAIGMIVSFVVGYIAVAFLMKYLEKYSLMPFVYYRVLLAIAILFLF